MFLLDRRLKKSQITEINDACTPGPSKYLKSTPGPSEPAKSTPGPSEPAKSTPGPSEPTKFKRKSDKEQIAMEKARKSVN